MSEIPDDVIELVEKAMREAGITATRTNFDPIAKAILADRQRDQWQPIETAPKDGRAVLLFGVWSGEISGQDTSPSIHIGSFGDGTSDFAGNDYWNVSGGDAYSCWVVPTHWQPLPAAPKGE